jgi:hypothetical protein
MTDQWTTPWYPGDVKPHRKGVYERQCPEPDDRYSYWNGEFWAPSDSTIDGAMDPFWIDSLSDWQTVPWRGLTREAE